MVPIRKLFGGLGNSMFQYAYLYSQWRDGKIPDIYVQDEKYFSQYKDEIKKIYGKGIGKIDAVSIHVRRGDYINNPFYTDLTKTDYYERAIALFPDENFLIFCKDRQIGSDDDVDMKWCKNKFKGDKFEFFESDSEIDDMNAMASCKAHIIANSSFSWWAAYLGGGEVIAPKEWFSDGEERIRLPDNWKRI